MSPIIVVGALITFVQATESYKNLGIQEQTGDCGETAKPNTD